MSFEFGDVVMFIGRPHFIIGTNDINNTLVVLDNDSTTFNVKYQDVVKIGHDDTFGQNIVDRLKNIKHAHDLELMENQTQLIKMFKQIHLKSSGVKYTITGNTKVDGKYLYCQIYSDKGYEWILAEELLDKFFK